MKKIIAAIFVGLMCFYGFSEKDISEEDGYASMYVDNLLDLKPYLAKYKVEIVEGPPVFKDRVYNKKGNYYDLTLFKRENTNLNLLLQGYKYNCGSLTRYYYDDLCNIEYVEIYQIKIGNQLIKADLPY